MLTCHTAVEAVHAFNASRNGASHVDWITARCSLCGCAGRQSRSCSRRPRFAQITGCPRPIIAMPSGFTLGGFFPKGKTVACRRGCDRRATSTICVFEVNDFNGVVGQRRMALQAEQLSRGGVGVGFYKRTRPERLSRASSTTNGSEIEQDSEIPHRAGHRRRFDSCRSGMEASSPTSASASVCSTGAGQRSGEFVDSSDGSIFRATYVDDGTSVGPVILAGIRAPVADVVGCRRRIPVAEGDGRHRSRRDRPSRRQDRSWWMARAVHDARSLLTRFAWTPRHGLCRLRRFAASRRLTRALVRLPFSRALGATRRSSAVSARA